METETSRRWYILLIPITLVIMGVFLEPVFYLNDDGMIRSILSGAYTGTPDGHVIYMQYPLSGILAMLYRIKNDFYWLEAFYLTCTLTCIVLVAKRMPAFFPFELIAFVIYIPFLIYTNYTLVAAVVAATGIFLFVVGGSIKWTCIFVLLAYMIRNQIGLLCLPFLLCGMVWRILSLERKERKKVSIQYIFVLSTILVGILICVCVNSVCYGSGEWKEYFAYNDARTELYDYIEFPYTEYEVADSTAMGITEHQYKILHSYNVMLDEAIDDEVLKSVEGVAALKQNQDKDQITLKKLCWNYCRQIVRNDEPYNYIWIVLYIFVTIGIICSKKWKNLVVLFILGTGRSFIWMYFMWKGRFPERVSLSLYLFDIALLLAMFVQLFQQAELGKNIRRIFVVSIAILLLGVGCYQWKDLEKKLQQREQLQVTWETIRSYCEKTPENLYLVDVFSAAQYAERQYVRDAENIKLLGGWTSYSPLVKEVFSTLGASDASEALYISDNVRLLILQEKEILWLEEYLQSRFGRLHLVKVGDVNCSGGTQFSEYVVQKE